MYKNFNITESEKEQILNRLKENGYGQPTNKKVISEQGEPEGELEQNPIGELRNDFHISRKDENGILYLLQSKRGGTRGNEYGVFNKSKMDWEHGYQPSFQESGIKLYQTQTGDSVLIEKYTGIGDKVFYTLFKIDGDDSTISTVKFLNTREYADVVKNLNPVDTDEPDNKSDNQGGPDPVYTDSVYEEDETMDKEDYMTKHVENPLNEGKKILKDVFKKLTEGLLHENIKLNEQGGIKLKLKRGDILTVVKKNDTSKSPVEKLAGVSVSYDSGTNERIGVRVTGENEIQVDLDSKRMEFGDYKITKINGQPVNKPVVKTQPIQEPIKPGSKGPAQLIDIVNVLSPGKVIMKLQPNYNLRWSEGTEGGTPQLVGKTDKGETLVMDFECGMREGNVVFTVIRYDNGKMITGDFMSLGQNINSGNFCGQG